MKEKFEKIIKKLETSNESEPSCILVEELLGYDIKKEYQHFIIKNNILRNANLSVMALFKCDWKSCNLFRMMMIAEFARIKGIIL